MYVISEYVKIDPLFYIHIYTKKKTVETETSLFVLLMEISKGERLKPENTQGHMN